MGFERISRGDWESIRGLDEKNRGWGRVVLVDRFVLVEVTRDPDLESPLRRMERLQLGQRDRRVMMQGVSSCC